MLSLYTAAAEMNKKVNFEGLHVHGLLTDLEAFHFYSYDPTRRKFAFDETLQASGAREAFIANTSREGPHPWPHQIRNAHFRPFGHANLYCTYVSQDYLYYVSQEYCTQLKLVGCRHHWRCRFIVC